jgi:alkylation response protein AidB-like acyl-CoA dehydrogenase
MERLGTAAANVRRLVAYAEETSLNGGRLIDKASVGPILADLVIGVEVGRLLCYKVAWLQSQGLVPNYEASISKAFGADLLHRVSQAGMRIAGLYGQLGEGSPYAPMEGFFRNIYLGSVPATISAGTNEIQRNIIAQRGLGLPRG